MKKKGLSMLLAGVMALSMTTTAFAGEGEQKEITVWVEKIFSDVANEKMQERLEQYGKENNVTVNCEMIGATDFVTKLNAAIEAGQDVPDIISADITKTLNYYPNIPSKDVSELVNKINEERPFFEASYEGTKIDGKHYFVPFKSSSSLMYIRKDKLEAAGITETPDTWDEVIAAAEKVTDPENDFYGLAIGCGENDDDDENTFRQFMWNQGGYIFDAEGNFTGDEKVTAVFDKYAELYNAQVIPPDATTWDAGGNNSSYLAGRTAICFNAPTLYNALKSDEQYAELLENTIVAAPPAGSENSVSMNYNGGFAIMNACEDEELASDVLSYLMDKEWYDSFMAEIAPIYGPVFADAKENPVWADDVANSQVLKYVENGFGYYGYPVETVEGRTVAAKHYFTYPFVKAANQVATGSATSEEALNSMKSAVEDFQDIVG